jgi:four helix bundle protein
MSKGGFKELRVWQKGKDLSVFIYEASNSGIFAKDYSLRDQMRRAAVSIPSNIAEGDERETDKDAVRYFYFAKGSSAEVLTQAIIAFEIGYIKEEVFEESEQGCLEISGMLSKLITARSKGRR